MDDTSSYNQVSIEILPMIRTYKDGRVERLVGTGFVPPSLPVDPDTGVASKDVVIHPETGLSARLYLPSIVSDDKKKKKKKKNNKLPVIIYYHGGGFCIGSAFSAGYHRFITSLASKADALIVSVEYRLAPEHPIPAAYDDAWEALQWVASASGTDKWLADHADFARVFLAGDSAGANIAHHMAMRGGLELKLKGVVLIHPFFWGPKRIGAEAEDVKASTLDAVWPLVCPAAAEEEDPRLNPLAEGAPSLKKLGCRRVLVCVAAKDILAERGRAYCQGLKGSGWGGEIDVMVSEDEDHIFHLFSPECHKAMEMMEHLADFINS